MKRRSFIKIIVAAALAPLSFLDAAAAPTITKTMELEGALADYIGFPAHGGYVYCPYIPVVSKTKTWGKITGWTTI